jgi:hypothetical protein
MNVNSVSALGYSTNVAPIATRPSIQANIEKTAAGTKPSVQQRPSVDAKTASTTPAKTAPPVAANPGSPVLAPSEPKIQPHLQPTANTPSATPDEPNRRLKEAAAGLEGMLARTLVRSLRSGLPQGKAFGAMARDIGDQALADVIGRRGMLGVAPNLVRQLSANQGNDVTPKKVDARG